MRKADNLPPSCTVVTKSGNFNFLEPSGPLQSCNRTALLICTGSTAYLGNYWVVLRTYCVVRDLVSNDTCYLFAVSLTL